MSTKRFTGQYHESSLPGGEGLSYYNARWYDPKLGRFLSADSIVPGSANPQAFNRYSYVINNPLKYVDPTGHSMAMFDPGPGGGGRPRPPISIPAWRPASQYSAWNSGAYSGCFMCHAGGGRVLTNAELLESYQQMNQAARSGIEVALISASVFVTYGASGGFAVQRFAQAEQNLERTTVDDELIAVSRNLIPVESLDDIGNLRQTGSVVNWTVMGTNNAGTTFIGSDNEVRGVEHLTEVMQQYGPGRSIAGWHGFQDGTYVRAIQFYFEDVEDLGEAMVIDVNTLSPQNIRPLGGPGDTVYLNWCFSLSCKVFLENLNLAQGGK